MAEVEIRDVVMWAKHIRDDDTLKDRIESLNQGDLIELTVDGVPGTWEKMRDGSGIPTPGIKPVGKAKDLWGGLQHRRGSLVSVELTVLSTADLIRQQARQERLRARSGELQAPTPGLAPGAVQGNVAILPKDWAEDFMRFCHLNPKPCPLLTASRPGEYILDELGVDVDIRTDVPLYRVFREGVLADEVSGIRDLWQDDFVAFVLGCSFSFEEALVSAGLSLRHWERGTDVAMYRTNIATAPSGPYRGPMVVSMRPFKPADAIRAIQITSRFPRVHGAPVHFGDPAQIGIKDIVKPDWGDPVPIAEGEVPVFWACGVTPQSVIEQAKPPICITHRPGHMLITDMLNAELASF